MLILTRRLKETIVMGENREIEVTILGVRGTQVKLGIAAPKDMPVHREEIFERIQAEKETNND